MTKPLNKNELPLPTVTGNAEVRDPVVIPAHSEDDFDWNNPDEESIVLREQRATAVYRNRSGEVIIRQRSWPDEDTFVFIAPEFATAFMEGMAEKLRK
ncbi:MAG: hypothetical protein Q8M18_10975 [Bradyrhizobium sp.]|nr:hypothetical protein [Bradyrhizobium sp.]